ncbi:hypothetical protein AG1IA_08431 [Rhizoctonia solani AG-1 IA]|uniref:PcRGLX/YetA-like C-terminal alpha/alpha toroid domain-containing protein n=1 Tax=Thanatephorus cucumeris (strain AG1-IA) TaxID=983506 RepID=L8WMF9_THACA|nr:hypothetical protein AG1IA_08431 [Rhizoctonia solani AG-1 IA]
MNSPLKQSRLPTPPQLVASPEFYQSHKLFGGRWNVPNKSRSGAAKIENEKSFWNYGDVMHTYDDTRHTWRYDVGGYVSKILHGTMPSSVSKLDFSGIPHILTSDNFSGTDLWLWMSFLRTGRADVFRIAHAMTRHLSEGPFAGLGSRHNVSHWGDGAKEARVSSSTLKRPFYYLTADEQIGDLMRYSLQADKTLIEWEPLRKILPKPTAPTRVRIGPDWTALAGWAAVDDFQRGQMIPSGETTDIGAMKYGLFTGYTSGAFIQLFYTPDFHANQTLRIKLLVSTQTPDILPTKAASFKHRELWENKPKINAHLGQFSYHLTMLFGGGEFLMELVDTVSVPSFDIESFDLLYKDATSAEKTAKYGQNFNSGGFGYLYAKLQAYAGERLNDNNLKQLAWNQVTGSTTGYFSSPKEVGGVNVVEPIKEITSLATNDAASFSLAQYVGWYSFYSFGSLRAQTFKTVLAIAPELAPNSLVESRSAQYTLSLRSVSTVVGTDYGEKAAISSGTRQSLGTPRPKPSIFKRFLRLLRLSK